MTDEGEDKPKRNIGMLAMMRVLLRRAKEETDPEVRKHLRARAIKLKELGGGTNEDTKGT